MIVFQECFIWLAPEQYFWRLMGAPGGSWELPGRPWQLLAVPGGSGSRWRLLAAPGGSWQLLAAPGMILETSGAKAGKSSNRDFCD